MSTTTVIGAGIAGLSCAFDLKRAGVDVRVLDPAPEPGGVMRTVRAGEFQFEDGPNSIPGSAAAFRELCTDAGLAGELVHSTASARTRFLFFRGKLVPLPMGPGQLIRSPLLSLGAKFKLVSEPWRRWDRSKQGSGDSEPDFDAFLTERFGREVARTLGASFVRGIYASESTDLGTASAFPRLWEMVQQHGGVLRGMRNKRRAARAASVSAKTAPDQGASTGSSAMQLISLERGLGSLPDALAQELSGQIDSGVAARALAREGTSWRIDTDDGPSRLTEQVVLATPAGPTARLLQETDVAAQELAQVAHASVCVVSLGFERDFLPDGFGFLVPPDEKLRGPAPRALGILFVSKMFEGRTPPGAGAISAIYRAEDTAGKEQDELVQLVLADLALALQESELPQPQRVHVRRWNDAIPRYAPGHRARVERVLASAASRAPGLHLIGSYAGGVSVDDRIRAGRACARGILAGARAAGALEEAT